MLDTLAYNDSVQHVVDSLKHLNVQLAVDTGTSIIPAVISQNYPEVITGGVVGIVGLIFGWLKIRKAKKGKK